MGECSFWYRPTQVVPDQRPLNGRCKRSLSTPCCKLISSSLGRPSSSSNSSVYLLHLSFYFYLLSTISDDLESLNDVLSGGNSLANLTTDIASMANMVAQLKRSEREKRMMKIQYEEKLAQQQQKIRETEMERDQVLASLGKTHHFSRSCSELLFITDIHINIKNSSLSITYTNMLVQSCSKVHNQVCREGQNLTLPHDPKTP